jgi:hypothetical protein
VFVRSYGNLTGAKYEKPMKAWPQLWDIPTLKIVPSSQSTTESGWSVLANFRHELLVSVPVILVKGILAIFSSGHQVVSLIQNAMFHGKSLRK